MMASPCMLCNITMTKYLLLKLSLANPVCELLAQLSLEMKWDRLIIPAEPLTSHELQ